MLELKNLSVGYDGRYMIRNVNLTFEPGMIYTIVGKNGNGKSTLLKSCSGLLVPKVGSVLLDGKELSRYPANQRAQKVSYLSQSTNTPNITVERLLAHARFPYLSYPKKLRQEDIHIIYRALGDMKASSLSMIPSGSCQAVSVKEYILPCSLPRIRPFCCWMSRPPTWILNTSFPLWNCCKN